MPIKTTDRRTLFDVSGSGGSFSIAAAGSRLVSGQGSFGGGTLKLEISCGLNVAGDTELWRDFTAFTALTATGHQAVAFVAGKYRFTLTGATTPSIAANVGD